MKLNFKTILFTDERTLSHIKPYLKTENLIIEILPLEDFIVSRYDWEYQNSLDKERYHCPSLYMIWLEKVFFLRRAIEKNPYGTKYFLWNDIGSFRDSSRLDDFFHFPTTKNFEAEKVLMFCVRPFSAEELKAKKVFYQDIIDYRISGIFGGDKTSINWFAERVIETIEYFEKENKFYGKDQNIYNHIYLHFPDKVKLVEAQTYKNYDFWFFYQYYLSEMPEKNIEEPTFYVINLEERKDRWEEIQKLPLKLVRFNAIKGSPGHLALSQTLKNLIQYAKNENLKYICVLEDDATVEADFWSRFKPIFNYLMTHMNEWNIFQGGHTFTNGYRTFNRDLKLYFLYGGYTTHFMIYNSNCFDKFLEWDGNDHCDVFTAQVCFKRLATYPHLSTQRSSFSNLVGRVVDYDTLFAETNQSMEKFINTKYTLTCYIEGRLGNNLFQVAHLIAEGIRLGVEIEIPEFPGSNYFKNLQTVKNPRIQGIKNEIQFSYHALTADEAQNCYRGYFQSENYFSACKNLIRHYFEFDLGFDIKERFPLLRSDCCAVHVRRGDYLLAQDCHPTLNISYYRNALNFIDPNIPLIIFSDDLNWCRNNLVQICEGRKIHYEDEFFPQASNIEALAIMKECNFIIGSNSSFSWWAAWLNDKGIKIFPQKWFGPNLKHNDTRDLIPLRWLRLPE